MNFNPRLLVLSCTSKCLHTFITLEFCSPSYDVSSLQISARHKRWHVNCSKIGRIYRFVLFDPDAEVRPRVKGDSNLLRIYSLTFLNFSMLEKIDHFSSNGNERSHSTVCQECHGRNFCGDWIGRSVLLFHLETFFSFFF